MSVLPIVLAPGDGDVLDFAPGELLVWKGTLATTGSFDQFELTAEPGHQGAPLHAHAAVDECFYVLDGAFRFRAGDAVVVAETGSFLFAPRGTPHTWANALERASRMLLTFVPGGMRPFFDAAAPVMHSEPLDAAALTAVNEAHGTTVLGPPLPSGPDAGGTSLR